MTLFGLFLAFLPFVDRAIAVAVTRRDAAPTVQLDSATLTGASLNGVDAFLGIPFAQPPVGNLRFRLPQPHGPYQGSIDATSFGPACLQQSPTVDIPTNLSPYAVQFIQAQEGQSAPLADSEDCLTINVFAPATATPTSKLPVVFWIYGGGFETGGSSEYPGNNIVLQSLAIGEPVIYVSVNYRLNSLGFAGSKEIRQAGIGNLGLQDQRLGMRWVQKYISAFGGDPTKVTIWGQSAGAISVSLHLLTSGGNTEGLFRAAFMQSGSPSPTGPVEDGQEFFNTFATAAGCGHSLGSTAVFDCLRTVSTDVIRNATATVPSYDSYLSLSLAWVPRSDGVFLTQNPQQLVLHGSVAPVPFVAGECDDEGTDFSLFNSNITTEAQLSQYLQQYYVKGGIGAKLAVNELLSLYPADPTVGSPYGTGSANAITPQYKRIASLLGDITFQAPRRFFQYARAGKNKQWAYLSKRLKSTQLVGSYHGSDIKNIYGGGDLGSALIHFANKLDPNGAPGLNLNWPQYTPLSPAQLTLLDGNTTQQIGYDTYREAGIAAVTAVSLLYPL